MPNLNDAGFCFRVDEIITTAAASATFTALPLIDDGSGLRPHVSVLRTGIDHRPFVSADP